jgi:HTH-type transcriptional regulator, competence development regulator
MRSIVGDTLGQVLLAARNARKMTLRDVEQETKREVSNAYLSQLENGKISQPSPNILNRLAQVYKIDYAILMQMAGYAVVREKVAPQRGVLVKYNVTPEEEAKLAEYLLFLRQTRRRESEGGRGSGRS